jgi:hypothetical protein
MTMTTKAQKNIARLNYLREMLNKYSAAYFRAIDNGRECSSRMYDWIDEYNALRYGEGWEDYCKQHGSDHRHDAYDLFA